LSSNSCQSTYAGVSVRGIYVLYKRSSRAYQVASNGLRRNSDFYVIRFYNFLGAFIDAEAQCLRGVIFRRVLRMQSAKLA